MTELSLKILTVLVMFNINVELSLKQTNHLKPDKKGSIQFRIFRLIYHQTCTDMPRSNIIEVVVHVNYLPSTLEMQFADGSAVRIFF